MNRNSSNFSALTGLTGLFLSSGVALALCATGCSSSTTPSGTGTTSTGATDLSGSYDGNITNGTSSCPGNWQAGQVAQVTIKAVQSGSAISLDVTGASGLYVGVALGASTFNGTVSGDAVTASLHGTAQQTAGNCTYTWAATFAGSLSGDTLTGNVTYAPVTNGGSDCTAKQVEGCSQVQSFDGVRPATAPTTELDSGVVVTADAG
jgi:hypothetical protein